MKRRSYWLGVMLSASKNPQNRIQFLLMRNNTKKYVLYSRTSGFTTKWNVKACKLVGIANTKEELLSKIDNAREVMHDRGISVPGCQVFEAVR